MRSPISITVSLLAALALATTALSRVAAETHAAEAPDPFSYDAPEGWKPERIPFPLGFAPSLPYKGFEQLRFAPGMFDPKSDTYFTYFFFWWLAGEPRITTDGLARDLTEYYKGLCGAVGGAKKVTLDLSKVRTRVERAALGKPTLPFRTERFAGVIEAYDPFATSQPITLNVEIWAWRCDKARRTCIFFGVSPKPTTDPVWAPMRTALASFRCARPQ